MTVDAYIRVRLQYTDASNDCLVGPTVSRKWYNFQTPAFSLDAVYSSEGFVEEMKSRPTQGGGLGTSKRQRKQHGRKRSSKHFLGPDESRENSSNATCRGHGQADFPTPSRDTSDATVLKASQRSITIVGTSARSWVSGSRAGVPDQKKLEKQVSPLASARRKSSLTVPWQYFLLVLLAGLASGIRCGVSSGNVVIPSMVDDTAGALQLAEAMDCVDNGSFAVEWVGSITLATPIVVNGTTSLNVNGAEDGSSWVDGASQQSLFRVWHGGTLSLSGLNLFRGNNHNGGAIYARASSIRVANCSFNENNATFGGAIYAYSSNVSVANCSFNENNATSTKPNAVYGGAIYAYKTNISVSNCSFIANKATSGGAIYLSSANMVLSNANFFGNVAYSDIGYGGAIYPYLSDASVANSLFVGNHATSGGAIFLNAGNLVLFNANFYRNFADDSGGAVYGHVNTTVVVYGSAVWENNTAEEFGGAIRLHTSCVFNISGSARITGNVAEQGGGVWLQDTAMTTTGSAIFNKNSVGDGGGGIYVYDSFAYFLAESAVYFVNNIADEGGATSQYMSGFISIGGKASFTNNTARRGGSMMLQEGTGANISGEVMMSGNTASSSGGAMHCEATTSLEIYNTRFVSNHAGSSGGAITALSSGTRDEESVISWCSFEDNIADDAGGAMFIAGGFMDISGSTFTRNTAGRSGGAVITSGVTSVSNCLFVNNRAFIGPAVSNTVSILISWTDFDDNALLCDDGYFLDFSTNVSAYEMACHDCLAEADCENCVVRNRDEVQVCEPVLAHTVSPSANGTLQSLELQEGFWRISSTSKDVRECYEADACVGGVEPYCAAGYTGPYCAVCTDGYARGLGNLCLKCSEERRSGVIALASVFIVVIVAAIVTHIPSLAFDTEAGSFLPRRVLEMARSRFKGARMYQAFKIVVVSWQIVTQFSEVASVTYPDVYEAFLGYVDVFNLNLGWMLSAGCVVNTNFYADLYIATIGPLFLAFLVLVSYTVNSLRRPPDNNQARSKLRKIHGAFLFWISFLVYSTVSSSIFQTFACDKLDNGKSYLRSDYSLECYTVEHKIIMSYAGVMAILYPFGIPFCYGLILYRNRSKLKVVESREASTELATFKDLWLPYRPEVFFYEVIECLRRIVLSGIVVFVFPNTAGQIAMTFLFALGFFAVILILNPYINQWDTWLARFGHAIVMMTMFVTLLQKVDTSEDDMFSQNVFGGVLVAANCVMVLAVGAEACGLCFLAVREVSNPVQSTLEENQDVLESSATENIPASVSS